MVNYQDGKIYKIICKSTGRIYIGSTCQKYLSSRLQGHLQRYRNYERDDHFVSSFPVLENNDWEIALIENYPCDTKEELHARERYWKDNSPNSVNIRNPIRTKDDDRIYANKYRSEHLDLVAKNKKKHYEKNKDNILLKQKQNYEKNREEVLLRCKIYRDNHQDQKRQTDKAYREKNREKIRQVDNEKNECPCGGRYSRTNKIKHMRTTKHQEWETSHLFSVLPFSS